jgi:hypothetical protein
VMPRALAPNLRAMWRLLPPMPQPTSTICSSAAAARGVRQAPAAAAAAARQRQRSGAAATHVLDAGDARPAQHLLDHVHLRLLVALGDLLALGVVACAGGRAGSGRAGGRACRAAQGGAGPGGCRPLSAARRRVQPRRTVVHVLAPHLLPQACGRRGRAGMNAWLRAPAQRVAAGAAGAAARPHRSSRRKRWRCPPEGCRSAAGEGWGGVARHPAL